MPLSFRRGVPIVITISIVAVAAVYVFLGTRQPWDFETYYAAGTAVRAGLNPYALDALSAVTGRRVELPFLYPPITFLIFVPLSALPFTSALALWLGLNATLLLFLLRLWRREFLRETSIPVLVATALLGFNLSTLWNLRTGNVGLVEAAFLWLAFAAYQRDHIARTSFLIVGGSVFKLLPAALLGLLAMAGRSLRVRALWIAGGLALLLVAVSLPPGLAAAWRESLVSTSEAARPTGEINPSALGLADGLVSTLELPSGAAPVIALGLYLLYGAVILLASIGPWLRARESGSRSEQVMLMVLLWLLLSPRAMVYSYVMAIVPTLHVIETRIRSQPFRWIAVGLIMTQGFVRLLPGQPPTALAPTSFLILVSAWLLFRTRPVAPAAPRSPAPSR